MDLGRSDRSEDLNPSRRLGPRQLTGVLGAALV